MHTNTGMYGTSDLSRLLLSFEREGYDSVSLGDMQVSTYAYIRVYK